MQASPATKAEKAKVVLRVSDHALVRWLERVHGIDMEDFRSTFLQQLAGVVGHYVPDGEFSAKIGGVAFVVIRGVVVTTLDGHMRRPPARREAEGAAK